MRKMETRKGYVKFLRLGAIEFGEQSRWSRAPRSRGLWAFPYPFFDMFFAYHKFDDITPKRFRSKEIDTSEEREEWINKVGRKILPIREFWYKGNVFSHFNPNGEVGFYNTFGMFDNEEESEWSILDATQVVKNISSSGGNKTLHRFEKEGELFSINTSIDHMEVFIAPGMGQIREGKP